MIAEKFQKMINEMSSSLDRTIGIIDSDLDIIACSNKSNVGKVAQVSKFESISTTNVFVEKGITYKYFGSKKTEEYAIFVSGDDKFALSYVDMLSVSLTQIVSYYTSKHSKSIFIKNLILDNILPGELNFRIRELKIHDKKNRVCMIVHSEADLGEVDLVSALRMVFPDATKDFVIEVGERTVAIVKELSDLSEESKLNILASSIVSVLASEYGLRTSVGVGSVARNLSDLPNSFRYAQVASEVRKVFDNEQSIAMYSQLGIARLIYQLPVTLCKVFLDEVFKKCSIESIDHDLMYTISKFFENSLNISETSRKLFVHRNTLVYRIDKIKRLTGLDLKNFEDAIEFKIALMVNKYLKNNKMGE